MFYLFPLFHTHKINFLSLIFYPPCFALSLSTKRTIKGKYAIPIPKYSNLTPNNTTNGEEETSTNGENERERIPNLFGHVCYVVFVIDKFKICFSRNKQRVKERDEITDHCVSALLLLR